MDNVDFFRYDMATVVTCFGECVHVILHSLHISAVESAVMSHILYRT